MQNKTKKQSEQIRVRPFLKWAGGKTRSLQHFREYYPSKKGKTFKRYIEPFLGSGAVFFDLLATGELCDKQIILADNNIHLINCYKQLKSAAWHKVHNQLLKLCKMDELNNHYYSNRDKYNEFVGLGVKNKNFDPILCAALFIYLNKTCFNGLYRVNSNGFFNVPEGRYHKKPVFNLELYEIIHKTLKSVSFKTCNYRILLHRLKPNKFDFIYIDPPYIKLSKTANFTGYDKEKFDIEEQHILAKLCIEIQRKGVYLLVSNHLVPQIVDMYPTENFAQKNITLSRCINSIASKRKDAVKEILFISK